MNVKIVKDFGYTMYLLSTTIKNFQKIKNIPLKTLTITVKRKEDATLGLGI